MLKKVVKSILKSILIAAIILWVGFVTINILSLDKALVKIVTLIENQISDLQKAYNNSVENDVTLSGQIQDLTRSAAKEVDYNHIIRGDVTVTTVFGLGSGTVIKKTDNEMYI